MSEAHDRCVPTIRDPLDDSPRLECGVFGVFARSEEVAKLAYYGLYALQHRGQEAAGIAVADGRSIVVYKELGLVAQVFDEVTLGSLRGHLAVGHCRYSTTGACTWENAQPTFRTTDAGTGLVHMSPDHGEEDFLVCKTVGIDPVFAVTDDGRYREDWLWLGGQGSVINNKFNAPDGPINSDLREAGALLSASADFKHSYPHSWRSKAKIIYRCTPQWFIPMDRPIGAPAPAVAVDSVSRITRTPPARVSSAAERASASA